MNSAAQLIPILPILVLGGTAVLLMIAVSIRRSHLQAIVITMLGLIAALYFTSRSDCQTTHYVTPLLVVDSFSMMFVGFMIIASGLLVMLSGRYLHPLKRHVEEYYILLLLATLGTTVLATSSHLVSFFLGLEILSVSLYALISYVRRREICIEAGIKYLVLAAVSSAFLLFGMALLYAKLGSMHLPEMVAAFSYGTSQGSVSLEDPLILAGLGLMLVGFGFKLAVVPFHMWTPDVYQGAPAPVTAFIATASKGAIIAVLIRFSVALDLWSYDTLWLIWAIIAGLSMFVGNLMALFQKNLKRMLAFSSIAHLGYLLVAFLVGGEEAITAVVFYLVAYSVTTLGTFGVITVVSNSTGIMRDTATLKDFEGFGHHHPWLACQFALALLSLAGIPLTAGFVGKFMVLTTGVGSSQWVLVLMLAVNSVIGAFYYLRPIVAMYLRRPAEKPVTWMTEKISFSSGVALGLISLTVLWLGIYPNPVIEMIQRCAGCLF
jgi:NADH-quinone oxidoreductase subunit N